MHYAITDIETTGGNARHEKITEIAIYKFDGNKITNQLTTLVNPERLIPQYIQQLTGITNEMVEKAPKFYEIARDIVELTEDCVFVAHNAAFDYNFIQREFKSLGYDYQKQYLCTVKLSRKLIPGLPSYSLGNLTAQLGISIENRHRASGDALATVELFSHLIKQHNGGDITDVEIADVIKNINENLDKSTLKALPEKAGVYYFLNENHEPIYIGKSVNIKKRIYSHFSNKKSVRAVEMKSGTAQIDHKLTGSELVALLLEAEEVKTQKPHYNRLLRRTVFNWGLFASTDSNGYINITLERNSRKKGVALVLFKNKKDGEKYIHNMVEKHELCQKLCGLYNSTSACFHHQIGMCRGACLGIEPPESYNERVKQVIEVTSMPNSSFFIVDKGRDNSEKAIVKIENGVYKGYGFAEKDLIKSIEDMHNIIEHREDNKDVQSIIKSFLNQKKYEEIIYF